MKPRKLYIDFETRSSKDLKKVTSRDYALDPLTEILSAAYAINDGPLKPWVPARTAPPRELRTFKGVVVAHGVHFESNLYAHLLTPRYDFAPPLDWICTAALCRANGLPGDLNLAARHLLGFAGKDPRGRAAMLKFSKPRKPRKGEPKDALLYHEPADYPDEFAALLTYNKQDTEMSREFERRLVALSEDEREVWRLDLASNRRGITIDLPRVRRLHGLYERLVERMRQEARDLGIENLRGHDQFKRWCADRGVVVDNCQADYLKTLEATGEVADMISRKVITSATSAGKLKALLEMTSPDDARLRDSLKYHGAHTGRYTGTRVQVHNLFKGDPELCPPVGPDETGKVIYEKLADVIESRLAAPDAALELVYGRDLIKLIRSSLRSCLISTPGKLLYSADFNAIEARVLCLLAGDKRASKKFRDGRDIYIDLAAIIYGIRPENVTPEQRDMGKRGELGCGFQMGPKKFKTTCARYGREISFELAKKTVEAYREIHPQVVRLWKLTENAAIGAVQRPGQSVPVHPPGSGLPEIRYRYDRASRVLAGTLPSGREMRYRNARVVKAVTPWGAPCLKLQHLQKLEKSKQYVIDGTYGGRLTENNTQATARDVMVNRLRAVVAAGYDDLFSSHDEVNSEKAGGDAAEYGRIMSTPPAWAADLPLSATCWTGKRYKK